MKWLERGKANIAVVKRTVDIIPRRIFMVILKAWIWWAKKGRFNMKLNWQKLMEYRRWWGTSIKEWSHGSVIWEVMRRGRAWVRFKTLLKKIIGQNLQSKGGIQTLKSCRMAGLDLMLLLRSHRRWWTRLQSHKISQDGAKQSIMR